MRNIWIALAGAMMISAAQAQPVSAPKFVTGDTWIYLTTREKGTNWQQTRIELTVMRAGADSFEVRDKVAGSDMPPRTVLLVR